MGRIAGYPGPGLDISAYRALIALRYCSAHLDHSLSQT